MLRYFLGFAILILGFSISWSALDVTGVPLEKRGPVLASTGPSDWLVHSVEFSLQDLRQSVFRSSEGGVPFAPAEQLNALSGFSSFWQDLRDSFAQSPSPGGMADFLVSPYVLMFALLGLGSLFARCRAAD